MPARLILNADDFGLTQGINQAVAELHQAGVLTSATLMANGPAFDHAVAIAHEHPTLGVGCHIVLTDGIPVADPASIPTLLAPGALTLRPTLRGFLQALLLGRITEDDIAREALLQVRTLQGAGIQPTHLDTHKHTHLFPRVLRPLLRAAQQTGVGAIRMPFEPRWSERLAHGSRARRATVRLTKLLRPRFHALLCEAGLRTANGTLAVSATGNLTSPTLAAILHALPADGVYELCCHPGYNTPDLDLVRTRLHDARNVEREALLREVTRALSRPDRPSLIRYDEISS